MAIEGVIMIEEVDFKCLRCGHYFKAPYEKGKVITGISEAERIEDVAVFHAGTAEKDGDIVTNGGRVLGVTALAEQLADAKARAYRAVDKIKFDGAYCRRDIADNK